MPHFILSLIFLLMAFVPIPQEVRAAPPEQSGLSTTQKSEVRALIAEYLQNNPQELLVALDNVQTYIQTQEAQAHSTRIAENYAELHYDSRDISLGRHDAPITIIEFFDYNCGYCKRSFEPLMNLLETHDDIRLIFKEFPILNAQSKMAAQYALALGNREHYIAFHSALMNHRGAITPKLLDKILRDIGAMPDIVRRNHKNVPIDAHLQATIELAKRLNIQGTPAFIINGRLYPGALSADDWAQAIAQARSALDG